MLMEAHFVAPAPAPPSWIQVGGKIVRGVELVEALFEAVAGKVGRLALVSPPDRSQS